MTHSIGVDSDSKESLVVPDMRFSQDKEDEEEEEKEEEVKVRQERRIERGNNISLYTQISAEVSYTSGKKKKTPHLNTSRGRKSSELQTYNPSSTNRAVDSPIRLVPSQDNSQELKDNTPPLSFSFKLYTKAF